MSKFRNNGPTRYVEKDFNGVIEPNVTLSSDLVNIRSFHVTNTHQSGIVSDSESAVKLNGGVQTVRGASFGTLATAGAADGVSAIADSTSFTFSEDGVYDITGRLAFLNVDPTWVFTDRKHFIIDQPGGLQIYQQDIPQNSIGDQVVSFSFTFIASADSVLLFNFNLQSAGVGTGRQLGAGYLQIVKLGTQ